jgi:hypothetical protein
VIPAELLRSPPDGDALYVIELGDGMSSVGASEFKLVMRPVAGARMTGDACGSFTLDSKGRRGVESARLTWQECWL